MAIHAEPCGLSSRKRVNVDVFHFILNRKALLPPLIKTLPLQLRRSDGRVSTPNESENLIAPGLSRFFVCASHNARRLWIKMGQCAFPCVYDLITSAIYIYIYIYRDSWNRVTSRFVCVVVLNGIIPSVTKDVLLPKSAYTLRWKDAETVCTIKFYERIRLVLLQSKEFKRLVLLQSKEIKLIIFISSNL